MKKNTHLTEKENSDTLSTLEKVTSSKSNKVSFINFEAIWKICLSFHPVNALWLAVWWKRDVTEPMTEDPSPLFCFNK